MISGDVPGYHEDLLPIIAAIIFMILRDQLMAVESVTFFFIRETEFFYFSIVNYFLYIDRRNGRMSQESSVFYTNKTVANNLE